MKVLNHLLLCALSVLLVFTFSLCKLAAQNYSNQIFLRVDGTTFTSVQYGRSFHFRDSNHMELHIGIETQPIYLYPLAYLSSGVSILHKNHKNHFFFSFSTSIGSYIEPMYAHRNVFVPKHRKSTLLFRPGLGYRLLWGKRKYFDVQYQPLSVLSWTNLSYKKNEFQTLLPIPGSNNSPGVFLFGFSLRMGFLFGKEKS